MCHSQFFATVLFEMGRLILFQRNIDLAGDDLYVPAIHSCCLHVIWLICISVVYGLVDDTCLVSANFTYYLVFHLLFLVAMIPLEITIALVSMSGTVAKIGMRKYLSFLFHVHIFLSLFEFGIQIFGMYVLYGRRPLANSLICLSSVSEAKVALGYLTIIWGFVASIFWVFYMAFILYASKTNQKLHITKYYDVWKQRLAFCGFHKKLTNGTDVLTEVAETFADYLHDVDWAPSDFLVGMLLLKREQKTIREANQERRRKDFLAEKNARMNNEASRKSQVGSFSSRDTPMDVMVAPIWDSVRNYMPFDRSSTSSAHGSINSFQEKQSNSNSKYGYEVMTKGHIPDILHFAKYAEVAYIEKQCRKLCKGSLLFFSNDNDIFKSPFFIARDDKWKCIVVSIRGTYSAADWLVDLQVEPELIPIPDLGPNKKHYTHKGIMRTAKNILRQLKQNDNLKNMIEDPQSPSYGYDVVVTGHSLGAV